MICRTGLSLQFENIQVAEAQNVEALQSEMTERKELQKQKQNLEIRIQTLLLMVNKNNKKLIVMILHLS